MRVTFVNHSSLLLEHEGTFLITDPWIGTPAFGSWLPTFPPSIDPAAIIALGPRLSLVISHLHGDHFDEQFIDCVDRSTTVIIPTFHSRHLAGRLATMGFSRVVEVDRDWREVSGGWRVLAFTSRKSDVDATVVVRTKDCAIIHGNDNWERWHEDDLSLVRDRLSDLDRHAVMYCSQANSASGYPLNYETFTRDQKQRLLAQKVARMCTAAMANCNDLGLTTWYPYAGYSSVFVRGHDEYRTDAIFATPTRLRELIRRLEPQVPFASEVTIAEFLPGDLVELPRGTTTAGFISRTGVNLEEYRRASDRLLFATGAVEKCETFRTLPSLDPGLATSYLQTLLQDIARAAVIVMDAKADLRQSLSAKRFGVELRDIGVYGELAFVDLSITLTRGSEADETLIVDSSTLEMICNGRMRANHLYIGYQGMWRRSPPNQFNSDIRTVLATYTYRVQPRLSPSPGGSD